MKKYILTFRYCAPVVLGIIVYLIPKPFGADPRGWSLLAIFVASISGIIITPLPMAPVALISMLVCILTKTLSLREQALSGFHSPIVWLVVFMCFIARGFVSTKLGCRIAYTFILLLGKYTLGLGYGIVIFETILAPAIPSGTARAGGIIYPIVKSLLKALESHTYGCLDRNIGGFLTLLAYQGNVIASATFLTAMAPNLLICNLATVHGVNLTWILWFKSAIVPALISVIFIPLIVYVIYPPETKVLNCTAQIASNKLRDIGNINFQEYVMILTVFGMIGLWIFGSLLNIDAMTVSLAGLCVLLVTKTITWEDALKEKEAWSMSIWLPILITMSSYLKEYGIIDLLSNYISSALEGFDWMINLVFLLIFYFYSHYFFSSNTAHISAMYSTFLAVAISAGGPPLLSALLLAFFSSLCSSITHYANGAANIYFGMGYVPIKIWWKVGFIVSVSNILIWFILGGLWWKIIGIW